MDHSPQNLKEKDRIEAAGGWVQNGRVNTVLGVSRSFGDIMYKCYDPLKAIPAAEDEEGGIWSNQSQVISKPEVNAFGFYERNMRQIVEMTVQPTHEFLILASDGLWAICSSSEAVNFVRYVYNAACSWSVIFLDADWLSMATHSGLHERL